MPSKKTKRALVKGALMGNLQSQRRNINKQFGALEDTISQQLRGTKHERVPRQGHFIKPKAAMRSLKSASSKLKSRAQSFNRHIKGKILK